MTTRKQLEEQIQQLRTTLTALEKQLEENKKFKLWKPQPGRVYWIINGFGNVTNCAFNGNYSTDESAVNSHNAIKTEEHAECRAHYLSAWNELAALAEQLNDGWKPDWTDSSHNYGLDLNYREELFVNYSSKYYCSFGNVYFKDKETAQVALETLSEKSKEILGKGYS